MLRSVSIPLFFSILLIPITTVRSTPSSCRNRWIHIRTLPSRFNLDLLAHCSDYPLYGNFCPFVANHGLGPKTHNRSQSWYRTDPTMLELIFHRRILDYPCLTHDPTKANAIYLPYYASIDALRYLYGRDVDSRTEHGLDLYQFLQSENPQIWTRNYGHDHFLVMARPAWDFSQTLPANNDSPAWGTSFLELPHFANLTALTLESRAWPWQEHAVPYPTSFHPASRLRLWSWLARVRRSRRTKLMLFADAGHVSSTAGFSIRSRILAECRNATAMCDVVDCSGGACERDPVQYIRPMLQASFCLQPPGDTPTRRETFDGIVAGCIPVFFEELSAKKQYGWHLPESEYRDFSVFIPKEEVVMGRMRVEEVLMRIPRANVSRMREKVMELVPSVLYGRHGSSDSMSAMAMKDAFDLAVDGVILRIRRRLHGPDEIVRRLG